MEEIEEPTLLQTLRAHKSEVTCADTSGDRLITGSGDRSLRLWRWLSGGGWTEQARAADAHRYGVTVVRWAASGVLLASGGVDGAARVWAGPPLALRRLLAAPGAAALRALCWAARGRLLAGHDDGVLCVWHVPRAQLLARLHAHDGALHAVAAPALGSLLLTACTHGVLKIFDLPEVCRSGTEEESSPMPLAWLDDVHDLGTLCVDVTEDGKLAATGGQDSLVRVWHTDGVPLCELRDSGHRLCGHTAAVTALRWAGWGDSALLASASLDRTARLWVPHQLSLRCVRVVHAHSRYLTCVVLAQDMRYMITGSNDKSLRMWSLGSFTLSDSLEAPCEALAHFGLGDLKGIGPLDEEFVDEHGVTTQTGLAARDAGAEHIGGARRLWGSTVHSGAINYIATHKELVATASSDGACCVFRWSEEARALQPLHVLPAHQYPAMAVDFAAGGAVLLSAGLDGRACLWDVESGVQLRSLAVPAGEEAGGGGVRAARASPRRAALLLLATDDALAPLWSLHDDNPKPLHVFAGHVAAVTCCAWAGDARLAATACAEGELRLHAPPPDARLLHLEPRAHDLASPSALELPDDTYLLATAGCDSLIKLWSIHYQEGRERAVVRAALTLRLHGGGAVCVRWAGALLASAGEERVARVWRVEARGAAARLLASVPAPSLAVALLCDAPLLVCGSLVGELAVWQLPPDLVDDDDHEDGVPPCFWNQDGVIAWLRHCITRVPGSGVSADEEDALIGRTRAANMTGSRLLSAPLDSLLHEFGFGATGDVGDAGDAGDVGDADDAGDAGEAAARMRDELQWLRSPPPSYHQERAAPHALRCPLTHRLLREPVFAADGYTYERGNIMDWFLAAGGAVSPVSGRRLLAARVQHNYALRDQLRHYLTR